MDNYDDLAKLTAAVQDTIISIAVIIGGIWTVFLFRVLRVKKKAEVELAELQHRLSFKPLINISLRAEAFPAAVGDGFVISADVTIDNAGSRDTTLFFPDNRRPFSVQSVDLLDGGDIELGARYETGVPFGDSSQDFSRGTVVRAGARVIVPFIVRVPTAGSYLAAFTTFPSTADRKDSVDAGSPMASKLAWTGRCYVIVRRKVSD
jgi:hypothetical protein